MRLIASVLGLLVIASGVAPAPHARAQRLVYIGTYTEKTASKGIYAFRFDDGTGALTAVGLVAETPSPSFLTASANGRFVYAVNELQTRVLATPNPVRSATALHFRLPSADHGVLAIYDASDAREMDQLLAALPMSRGSDFVIQMHFHPTGKVERALGISAFPSMHNAMAVIFLLAGYRLNRRLGQFFAVRDAHRTGRCAHRQAVLFVNRPREDVLARHV